MLYELILINEIEQKEQKSFFWSLSMYTHENRKKVRYLLAFMAT